MTIKNPTPPHPKTPAQKPVQWPRLTSPTAAQWDNRLLEIPSQELPSARAKTSFLWSKSDEGQSQSYWWTLNSVVNINTVLSFSLGPKAIILASHTVSSVDYTTLCYCSPEWNRR